MATTKSLAKSSSPSPLTIDQLNDVLNLLKRCGFPLKRWYELGLTLRLDKDTLDAIERIYPSAPSRCLADCLSQWLSRKRATFDSLSNALKSMNENAAADKLDQEILAKKALKAPPLKKAKSRSLSQSGRPPPLSKTTRSLSLTTEPFKTKPHQPSLTKQKSEPAPQKTPSKTQQPPPLAAQQTPPTAQEPSLNNTQQSPSTATVTQKPQKLEEKEDPLPSSPMEGSIEFITVKETLADLVSLLAGNDAVILSLNNHLFSRGIIPHDVHNAVAHLNHTPNERATRLINSLLATIQTHSTPNSVFSPLITALQKVGLNDMASKLMKNFKMKGGHVDPNLEQQPSVSEGPLQPVDVTAQSHTPQPTITGSQSSTPTTVILSSKDEVAANIGRLHSCFASLDSKLRDEFEELVEKGKVKLKNVARSAAAYLSIDADSLRYSNIDKLYHSLQPYYDFFNCSGILKHLTDTYLSKTLQTELAQYIDSVDEFSESSQLKHIRLAIKKKLSSLPAAASPTTSNQTKLVVIKLNDRWEEMTISKLKTVLKHYFGVTSDLFSHISFDYGSLVITLLVPASLSQSIIDTINNNKESMSRLGILEVAVDKETIPIRREDDNDFNTSLHESVKAGDSFEVSMLLQLGADPNSKDERGKSAVEIANEGGHTQIKEILLTGGGGRRKSAEKEEIIITDGDQEYEWNRQNKEQVVPLTSHSRLSQDNLEGLSESQIAGKKLFLVQGDKPQLMNWEEYGLRISVPEDSLSASETVEVSVLALVGGHFKFPDNTRLVSAVYAISTSPLLKSLRIEMQHCIDLSDPSLSKYLKFAVAPVHTASLPYQFSIIEGGEFPADKRYGSIERSKFCQLAIVGKEEEENGGGRNEESNGEEDGDSGDEGKGQREGQGAGRQEGGAGGVGRSDREEEGNGLKEPVDCTEDSELSTSHSTTIVSTHSTGIPEATVYAGQVFYQKEKGRDLMTFTAARDLNALHQYINKRYSNSKIDEDFTFQLNPSLKYIQLIFDGPQLKPTTGWSVSPHKNPCLIRERDILGFGDISTTIPPSCLVSIYAENSPHTVSNLSYSVPLKGVQEQMEIIISRPLRNMSSSGNIVSYRIVSEFQISPNTIKYDVDPVNINRSPPTAPPPTPNSTFRGDIALKAMTECTGMIKDYGIDNIHFLVDKLLEHKIISERKKKEITDGYTRQTAGERMDELLHIISSSIKMDGEVFGIFIDILREEGTRRTIGLADKLLEKYKE